MAKRDNLTNKLNNTALSISRNIREHFTAKLSPNQIDDFKSRYQLSGIIYIPSEPENSESATRRKWFRGIISQLPPGQIPEIARKILTADFKTLTRGENNEYFYVYPVPSKIGKKLLILSHNDTELAYLDDSGRLILIVYIISIFVIAGVYFLLYRFILSPFKKIKKRAFDAGRKVSSDDDVETVVAEYQEIIDELQEKESKLRALNEQIQQKATSLEYFNKYLLKSISSGIITMNKKGVILSVNSAAMEILTRDENKLVGKSFHEILKDNKYLITAIESSIQNNSNQPYCEYDFHTPDGNLLSLGVIISVVQDNTTNQLGFSILINDLTEIKNLRRELETKERLVALGEMAGGLAHQLRNSIGAILGYCRLTKKRLEKNNLGIDPIKAVESETKEAESLVDRFLNFARPLDFLPQRTNINDFLRELMKSYDVRDDCHHIKFVLANSLDNNREVEIDSLLLKQALTNIIDNSINAYKNESGTIELLLANSNNDFVRLDIRDYGCGIAADKLDKIFTPFYSSNPSGIGLGLPLAKKIIDLHQGRLLVESIESRGTTFSIILPLKQRIGSNYNRQQTVLTK